MNLTAQLSCFSAEAERAWQQRFENPSREKAEEAEHDRRKMIAKAAHSVAQRTRKRHAA